MLALRTKAEGMDRLPKKSDFTEYEIARIKSYFGPWPRALEAAGLIPSKSEDRLIKKQESRLNAMRKKTEALKKLKQ